MRIVYMGTPDFAVAALNILCKNNYNIVAVVTAPDRPAGRGMQLSESAVKKYAVKNNLKILQPEKLKAPAFLSELKTLNADLQIVVAFRMLPEVVWNMPPLGTINLHASLLPKYRGAAPINWAIIQGERETGVTTFKLKHEIDTGNILLQKKIIIDEGDNAGTLHDKMKEAGARLVLETVRQLEQGNLTEHPQPADPDLEDRYLHAPKLNAENCEINWNSGVASIKNFIRGLAPYPAAFTFFDGKKLKIFSATTEISADHKEPGTFETDQKSGIRISASDGFVFPAEIQMEGKKRMKTEDFMRGWRKP